LNTFIIDTIVILLSWNIIGITSELDAISVLQRLIKYLFLNCTHKNSLVMKSNLDLIKNFVELWKERIYPSTLIIYKLISDQHIKSKQNAIGLSLIDNTTTYNRLKQTNTFPLPTLSTQTKRTSLTINVDNRNK
ncbi:unnamed protein product, partial [Rotaria sordida]